MLTNSGSFVNRLCDPKQWSSSLGPSLIDLRVQKTMISQLFYHSYSFFCYFISVKIDVTKGFMELILSWGWEERAHTNWTLRGPCIFLGWLFWVVDCGRV